MYFGGVKAVDGFSMDVEEGVTIGIIGPNGAGKTTIFNFPEFIIRHPEQYCLTKKILI